MEQETTKPIYRVIIAGSRDFSDYNILREQCNAVLADKSQTHQIIIVSGAARGADRLGEQYAAERGYAISRKPADWNKYGRAAGPIRNEEMAKEADALIAFWDGESRGTKNMIELASKHHLESIIIWSQMTKLQTMTGIKDIADKLTQMSVGQVNELAMIKDLGEQVRAREREASNPSSTSPWWAAMAAKRHRRNLKRK